MPIRTITSGGGVYPARGFSPALRVAEAGIAELKLRAGLSPPPGKSEPRALARGGLRLILFCALFLLSTVLLFADGGTLQLQKKSQGFLITLFSSPVPLRAGTGDLSVMVQDAKDHSPVLDAHVLVHVSRLENGEIHETAIPATHDQATNKMLYAANVPLASAGDWKVAVDVAANGKTASVSGPLHVLPKRPPTLAYWPYFVAIPVIVFLFVVNQWLKHKRRLVRLQNPDR